MSIMSQLVFYPINFSGVELRSDVNSMDYEPHLHDTYSIGLMVQGNQTMRTGRCTEIVFPGSVQLHAPYQVHENRQLTSRGFSFRNIEISKTRLLQILDGQIPVLRSNLIADLELFQAFMHAFDALTYKDDALVVDELLTHALTKLFLSSEHSQIIPDLTPKVVALVRDYIHTNYMHSVTLDSLVTLTGISRVHISRVFKQHIGVAPHEYLVQLRVADAKAKIAAGMPVAEAAAMSGFADQSHLNRHFKRITRLTPGAYARSCYKRSRLEK